MSSAAPSTGRTMTARLAAALTASASRGLAIVTSPAPARSAPRAASRAAPVDDAPPDTTTAWPRAYLWPSTRGHGKLRAPERGRVREGLRPDLRQHARRNADIGDLDRTAMQPPGQQQMAGLLAKERHGLRRLHGRPHHRAGGAIDAARQIDGDRPAPAGRSSPRSWLAASALDRPVEAGAEQRVDDDAGAGEPVGRRGLRPARSSVRAASAASPLSRAASPTSSTSTRKPRSARTRAATKPSPPLLPGPATTTTRAPGGWRSATASATARPAFSISVDARDAAGDRSAGRPPPSRRWSAVRSWCAGHSTAAPAAPTTHADRLRLCTAQIAAGYLVGTMPNF